MSSIASVLPYAQIAVSILLVILILIQRSDTDLGSAFGADGGGGTRYARRGVEKIVFNITIIVGVLFVTLSLLALLK